MRILWGMITYFPRVLKEMVETVHEENDEELTPLENKIVKFLSISLTVIFFYLALVMAS